MKNRRLLLIAGILVAILIGISAGLFGEESAGKGITLSNTSSIKK
ncbi:MAG TPA: hypothetical protein PKC24_01465 [Cyclobacteriaceae bacterium]|nr:hypothetical protein [Cyclobacteriaceae bacterium]